MQRGAPDRQGGPTEIGSLGQFDVGANTQASGAEDACGGLIRKIGIGEQTLYRWGKQYASRMSLFWGFYNLPRMLSSIGYRTPAEVELQLIAA